MENSSRGNFILGLTAFLIPLSVLWLNNRKAAIKVVPPTTSVNASSPVVPPVVNNSRISKIKVFYGSTTGTSKTFANSMYSLLNKEFGSLCDVQIIDFVDYDEEKLDTEDVAFFLFSTWTDGQANKSTQRFMTWLTDLACDFRVSKNHLGKLRFAIFGLGGAVYGDNYGKAVRLSTIYDIYLYNMFVTIIIKIYRLSRCINYFWN